MNWLSKLFFNKINNLLQSVQYCLIFHFTTLASISLKQIFYLLFKVIFNSLTELIFKTGKQVLVYFIGNIYVGVLFIQRLLSSFSRNLANYSQSTLYNLFIKSVFLCSFLHVEVTVKWILFTVTNRSGLYNLIYSRSNRVILDRVLFNVM